MTYGSIFTAKFLAYDKGNFKLGASGFIEEGIGDEGDFSASRSSQYKLGYMGLLSYGYKNYGQVNLNVGYRSRKAEEVGDKHIGNEYFYRTSLMYHITKRWGAYGTVEGRNIRVADTSNPDSDGYLDYKYEHEMASQIGVTGYVYQNYKMDAYVGGGLSTEDSVGVSERYFGLSLTVPLMGGSKSTFVTKSRILDSDEDSHKATVEKQASKKSKKLKKTRKVKKPTTNSDDEIYSVDSDTPSKKDIYEKQIADENAAKKKKKTKKKPSLYQKWKMILHYMTSQALTMTLKKLKISSKHHKIKSQLILTKK